MWFGGRAAQDVWDAEGLRTLAERQVQLARAGGVLTVLPMALSLLMVARTFDGDLDAAEAICDDIDAILSVTGHPLPLYARIFVAAYRGQVEEVESRRQQLRATTRTRAGEGYALTVANLAEALVYNGAGRYREALAVGPRGAAVLARAGPRDAHPARGGGGRHPHGRSRRCSRRPSSGWRA